MPSAKNALSFAGLKFSNGNTAMLFSSGSERLLAVPPIKPEAQTDDTNRNTLWLRSPDKRVETLGGAPVAAALAACSSRACRIAFGSSGFPTPSP